MESHHLTQTKVYGEYCLNQGKYDNTKGDLAISLWLVNISIGYAMKSFTNESISLF